jgi:ferredoxin
MLKVNKNLCVGCGLCAQSCPRGAISLPWGQAEIDQNRCNSCRQCIDICPQAAIMEFVPISEAELKDVIANLKEKADQLLTRIERMQLKKQQGPMTNQPR